MFKKLIPVFLVFALLCALVCTAENDAAFAYSQNAAVAFLGPYGTFSHEAAAIAPGENVQLIEAATVEEALELLDSGACAYAVVPIENTIGGPAGKSELYLNMLLDREQISIVAQIDLPIRQMLIGLPGAQLSQIKTIYSHPQGFAQGKEWLSANLKDAECITTDSTAGGVKTVSELQDPACAAIAGPVAAEMFGLDIIAENIQIITTNVTRFYIVTAQEPKTETGDHAFISVICDAGELPRLMDGLTSVGCRLVSLHERSAKSVLGEYQYSMELENVDPAKFSEWLSADTANMAVRCFGTFTEIMP